MVGNSLGVCLELAKGIRSLPGWRKGVHQKKIETSQDWTMRRELREFARRFGKGIGKLAKNMPGDRRRKNVRLAAVEFRGYRTMGVRS
ncbi:hypothetical protein GW17_00051586 [Ensete ventricosum]|nr:hypothetical protein GW17_00051586 [Ensete ventricosum]